MRCPTVRSQNCACYDTPANCIAISERIAVLKTPLCTLIGN